jgi:hypothetical protein
LQQTIAVLSRAFSGFQELSKLRFPDRVKLEPYAVIAGVIAPVIVAVKHDTIRYASGKCGARQSGFFSQMLAEYAERRQPDVHATHPFLRSSASQGSSLSKSSPSSISSSQHPCSRLLPSSLPPQPARLERTSG